MPDIDNPADDLENPAEDLYPLDDAPGTDATSDDEAQPYQEPDNGTQDEEASSDGDPSGS